MKESNNLRTGSLTSFMLNLAQWLMNRVRSGKSEEEGDDESIPVVDRESILVTCNALVIFRYLIHKIIMDCENNVEFLKSHIYNLPLGFKLSPSIYENYCYIDEESNMEFKMDEKQMTKSPLVVRIFIESLFLFLSESKVTIHNYLLHLEVLNCLLVLFSTSLYGGVVNEVEEESNETMHHIHESGREHNIFLEEAIHIMKTRKHYKPNTLVVNPSHLVHALLQNHVSYRLSKRDDSPFQVSIRSTLQKIFSKLGETAASILYLPYNTYRNIFYKETKEMEYSEKLSETLPELLGRRSIMNLLILIFYGKNDDSVSNPYSHVFSKLKNSDESQFTSDLWKTSESMESLRLSKQQKGDDTEYGISFEKIYMSVTRDFEEEECTLLTYSLLHDNKAFRELVLSRGDSETFLLPLLHKIYNSKEEKANHIYTLLIILTLLTQDASFVINTHKQVLISVPWFTERILDEIRLGSLIVVVLVTLTHYNISHQKDMYLNKFCLAIISNMGPYFVNIHTYAAQRLVTLTRLLTLKCEKIFQTPTASNEEKETYYSLLKTSLETINCILVLNKEGGLRKNLRLVYELLYQRRMVKKLEDMRVFADFVHNMKLVVEYFDQQIFNIMSIENKQTSSGNTDGNGLSPKAASVLPFESPPNIANVSNATDFYDEYAEGNRPVMWSAETYMECIFKASQFWSMSKAEQQLKILQFFPFQFSEDSESESFFISYMWNVIARCCDALAFSLTEDETVDSLQVESV